jgi:hypothetical protein
MYLSATKAPSLLTSRIKAEVIYNQFLYISTSQTMLFRIHHLFIIRESTQTKLSSAQIQEFQVSSHIATSDLGWVFDIVPTKIQP